MTARRIPFVAAGLAVLVLLLTGCSLFGDDASALDDRSAPTIVPLTTSSTLPPATTTTLQTLLWFEDHESIESDSGEGTMWDGATTSGKADVEVVSEPTVSGDQALKLINWEVDGTHSPGVRMRKQRLGPDPENLPTDAYYSVWYYVPFPIEGRDNIFQFKQADVDEWDDNGNPVHQTRRMLSKVSMDWDGRAFDLEYRTRIDQTTGEWRPGEAIGLFTADTDIPVGEWFHLEMRYVWDTTGNGRSTLWLNGEMVWDLEGIYTEASNLVAKQEPRQWTVNHYLSDEQGFVEPGDSWIFIDDAKISTVRVGP